MPEKDQQKILRQAVALFGRKAISDGLKLSDATLDAWLNAEHGVGSRKRDYLSMSRTAADIAAMRAVKAAFDPGGYLNPAVLFD